jgi:pimeloyl-ACP methyl ester carboxylesterase
MSMLATTVGLGLGAWAIGLGGAALAQRRLIFRPPVRVRGLPPGPHAGGSRIEPLSLRCADGALLQGWRSTPLDTPPQGWLLYFGGRGEDVAWAPLMSSYLGSWAVVAFNYRGFGGSTGRATEPLVMRDARCLHARFIPAGMPRVLMGRSLGTAVALRLAAEVAPQGLVLVSPFVSLVHLARSRLLTAPGAWLLRHRLDSRAHAPRVTCPSLVLLAEGDREVPNRHSQALAARLGGPVELATIADQAHRSLPRCVPLQQRVAAFVRSRGAPTA